MTYILQDMMFIHIPKTGGHSVLEVMKVNGGYALKDLHGFGNGFSYHEASSWIREKLGDDEYDTYHKVTLMRNPWERAVGLYYGEARPDGHSGRGFRIWIRSQQRIRYKSKDKRVDPITPQSWMIGSEVRVFDLARIEELWAWMQATLDIKPIKPGHVMSGKSGERMPYRDYYSPIIQKVIAKSSYVDIARMGWKF